MSNGDKSESAATAMTRKGIERQAIVVVHGQGELRPMGTLRDFVKVLWRFNGELGPLPPGAAEDGRKVWIVPDDKSGLFELQRVTTPSHAGRRTDFFELYFADLLNESPIRNFLRWLQRLLLINPADVPARMRLPWSVFWILSLASFVLCGIVVASLPQLTHQNWLEIAAEPRAQPGLLAGGLAILLLLLPKFSRSFRAFRAIPTPLLVLILVAAFAQVFWPHIVAWSLIALAGLIYLAEAFLLPYFGDAANYLGLRTDTVQSRQVVRSRGLRLLRALHDDPLYDRVVVIGHSLGSVLAYDLLHILWREVGPTKDNPPDPEAVAALEAVDAFTASRPAGRWSITDVEEYQALQWQAFDALRRQPARPAADDIAAGTAGWKISDFVALGSPLSSAQFLITESKADFIRMKKERLLPTAPPQPYDDQYFAVYPDENQVKVAHHGAVFSAVRWTNIYDEFDSPLFLFGDPIGGPLSGIDRFGDGVLDCDVEIRRGRYRSRFFTHNYYWTETNADWTSPSAHISALRKAVGVDRPAPD